MQSESYNNMEYCWRDQQRQRKVGGGVTEAKRHQGTGPEGEEGSYNFIHIKNDWWGEV